MISEMAIADAYAQAFEFVKNPAEHGLKNQLVNGKLNFQQNPKYPELSPGDFTDDTIRTMAAYSCLSKSGQGQLTPELHFCRIYEYFWGFYRKGWSGRFQKFIEDHENDYPHELICKIVKKDTNGAIMGVLPFGYLDTIYNVKTAAAMHAFSTHSASTIPYAQAAALCVCFLKYNKGKDAIPELRNFLLDNVEELCYFQGSPTSMRAADTFNVVLNQIEKADKRQFTMTQLVMDCVNLGGDTDTIAALCAGIYSHSWHYLNNPADYFVNRNFDDIERGNPQNRDILVKIDEGLGRITRNGY